MFLKIALIGSVAVNCMLLFYFFYDRGQSAQLNSQVQTSTSTWMTCTKPDGTLETTSFIPDEKYSSSEQYLKSSEASEKNCKMANKEEILRKKVRIEKKEELDLRLEESVEFNPRRDF